MEIEADAPCKRSYRVFLEVFMEIEADAPCKRSYRVFLEVFIWRLKPMLHVSAPTVCVS